MRNKKLYQATIALTTAAMLGMNIGGTVMASEEAGQSTEEAIMAMADEDQGMDLAGEGDPAGMDSVDEMEEEGTSYDESEDFDDSYEEDGETVGDPVDDSNGLGEGSENEAQGSENQNSDAQNNEGQSPETNGSGVEGQDNQSDDQSEDQKDDEQKDDEQKDDENKEDPVAEGVIFDANGGAFDDGTTQKQIKVGEWKRASGVIHSGNLDDSGEKADEPETVDEGSLSFEADEDISGYSPRTIMIRVKYGTGDGQALVLKDGSDKELLNTTGSEGENTWRGTFNHFPKAEAVGEESDSDHYGYYLTWEGLFSNSEDAGYENPEKEGKVFAGWYKDAECTEKWDGAASGTVYAAWADAPEEKDDSDQEKMEYRVVHKLMDLDGVNYTEKESETIEGVIGKEVTPEVKEYEGFTAPETVTVKLEKDKETVVEYKYARNKYAFTLHDTEGADLSESTQSGSKYYGETIVVKCTPKKGYSFVKWDNGTEDQEFTFKMPAEAVDISAIMESDSDDGDDGKKDPEKNEVTYSVKHLLMDVDGQKYTLKETENLTGKTGDVVTPATKTYEGFEAPATKTVKLPSQSGGVVEYRYARKQFNLKINQVEGVDISGSTPSSARYFGSDVNLKCVPANGYEFVQWSNGDTNQNATFKMPAKDVEVNPVVRIKSFRITYDLDGGTATNPESYTMKSEAFTLNVPVKQGYTFAGWTGANGATPQVTVTINKGTVGDLSFKANWTASGVVTPTVTPTNGAATAANSLSNVKTGDTMTPSIFAGTGLGAIAALFLALKKRKGATDEE